MTGRRAREWIARFAWPRYLALALAYLWPLPLRLTTAMPRTQYWWDAICVLFMADTSRGNLFGPGNRLDSLIYYPHPQSLAYSEHFVGFGVVFGPLEWVSRAFAYNVVLILFLVLAGVTMERLARRLGAGPFAAAVAGTVFAFMPPELGYLARLQFVGVFAFPLTWLALLDWLDGPTAWRALWLGIALALPGFFHLYYLAFGALTAVILGLTYLIARGGAITRRHWLSAACALPPLAATLLYNLPYLTHARSLGLVRTWQDIAGLSGTVWNLLTTDPLSMLWGRPLGDSDPADGSTAFPGVAALVLALLAWAGPDLLRPFGRAAGLLALRAFLLAAGVLALALFGHWAPMVAVWIAGAFVVAWARRRLGRPPAPPAWVALTTVGFTCLVLFFGPLLVLPGGREAVGPWRFVMEHVPGFAAARGLRRFILPAVGAFVAVGAAVATRAFGRPGRLRWPVLAGVAILVALDLWPAAIPLRTPERAADRALWQHVAALPDRLPVYSFPFVFHAQGASYMDAALYHRHPTPNGHMSFYPEDTLRFEALGIDLQRHPAACAELMARLRAIHVGYVTVSAMSYAGAPIPLLCIQQWGGVLIFHDRCDALYRLPAEAPAAILPVRVAEMPVLDWDYCALSP